MKHLLKTTGNKYSLEKNIFDYISVKLSPERFYHSICVAELAVRLALFYKEDVFVAQTSALLHDCAKNMNIETMKEYIDKNSLKIPYYGFAVSYLPQILHSFIAADIAVKKFGIKDKRITETIKNHTLGRIAMSACEKILFVADALSSDRNYMGICKHRKLLFKGLDDIFRIVLGNKINFIISKFGVLHPGIVSIWNYYNKKI